MQLSKFNLYSSTPLPTVSFSLKGDEMCRAPYMASGGQRRGDWISAGWCQLGNDLNTIPANGLFSRNLRGLDVHTHVEREKSSGWQVGGGVGENRGQER